MSNAEAEARRLCATWMQRIRASNAYDSSLYAHFAEDAPIESIVRFLEWDAQQPPFHLFLRLWLPKMPAALRPALQAHIREEEQEDHAGLFRAMLRALRARTQMQPPALDAAQLAKLNHVFSARCAEEETAGYFLGVFVATEAMSQRRCEELYAGLQRLGVSEALDYLKVHAINDADHWREVVDHLIVPGLVSGSIEAQDVAAGIEDRLRRSAQYLKWYEAHCI